MRNRYVVTVLSMLIALGLSRTPAVGQEVAAERWQTPSEMIWATVAGGDEILLRVVGPDGVVVDQRSVGSMSLTAVNAQGAVLPDGAYKYELRVLPHIEKAELEALVESGDIAQVIEIKQLAQVPVAEARLNGWIPDLSALPYKWGE